MHLQAILRIVRNDYAKDNVLYRSHLVQRISIDGRVGIIMSSSVFARFMNFLKSSSNSKRVIHVSCSPVVFKNLMPNN